jgi:hypothetical protein
MSAIPSHAMMGRREIAQRPRSGNVRKLLPSSEFRDSWAGCRLLVVRRSSSLPTIIGSNTLGLVHHQLDPNRLYFISPFRPRRRLALLPLTRQSIHNSSTMASTGVNVRTFNFSLTTSPDADPTCHRSSAGQHSASVSHTASTTRPPSLPPTSCARTSASTTTSRPSSTRPVKSTRRRLLLRPSLAVRPLVSSCLISLLLTPTTAVTDPSSPKFDLEAYLKSVQ